MGNQLDFVSASGVITSELLDIKAIIARVAMEVPVDFRFLT